MAERTKLPRSVIVLNIIMIVLILVICGLVFSLAFSDVLGESKGDAETLAAAVTEESAEQPEEETADAAATTSSTAATPPLVEMTKRSTEPVTTAEPIVEFYPSEEADPDPGWEMGSTDYSKEFFADDLFIGDSITTGLYAYGKLDMRNVAAAVGYTPYKAYSEKIDLYDGTSATALEYAERMQPKRIYIMLGSNGIVSASAMEDSYRNLIDKLKEACPSSVLYCLSVTPVTSDSSAAQSGGITNDMVRDFNEYIEQICGVYGIQYLDIYTLVLGTDGCFSHDYAEVDGLHFKGVTYDVMLHYIQETIS